MKAWFAAVYPIPGLQVVACGSMICFACGTMIGFWWLTNVASIISIVSIISIISILSIICIMSIVWASSWQILEVTKSTYEKPLQKLVKEVSVAKVEASDIHLYLKPLAKLLQEHKAAGDRAVTARSITSSLEHFAAVFRPALHMISLIYSHSEFYCKTVRLQAILEKFCNDVIHEALQYVKGSYIFTMDAEEMEERLKTTIRIFAKLRGTYLEVRAGTQSTHFGWAVEDDLVFNLPDQFVERCHDMIDVVQMTWRFAALKHIEVGGHLRMVRSMQQINTQFHQALKQVQTTGYDLLDIAAKKYDDDFFQFRRTVRDCERRLGSLMAERLVTFTTVSTALNFLACFEMMLDRKTILTCIHDAQMQVLLTLSVELDTVCTLFQAGNTRALLAPGVGDTAVPPAGYVKDTAGYLNIPDYARRVYWSRSLAHRLDSPFALAARLLSNIMHLPPAVNILATYHHLRKSLCDFEDNEIQSWLASIDMKFAEKLKQPLLKREMTSSAMRVNFDVDLMALLREGKYLKLIGVEMPSGVGAVYTKCDMYQQHHANLQMMVNDYNLVLSAMNQVEVPLMMAKLEVVDEALEEGMELLNWRNHSIASFIKKTTSYIANASALLKLLQTNVKTVCELLRKWSTASLHRQRKKTVGAEEYLETLRTSVEARYVGFALDAKVIGNLIAQIHLALQVSRGDSAWREYVAHVNQLIIHTLLLSVTESLKAIITMLQPSERNDGSAALVEVRLELVAPDVLFNPDLASNLSASGLEDVVEFWISSTVGVANLLPRIDLAEGTYLHLVAQDAQVVSLTQEVRDLAEQAFENLRHFKAIYENFSGFWLEEAANKFGAFVAELGQDGDSGGEDMVLAFDQQIRMLNQTQTQIKKLQNRQNMVWVSVDAKPMKQALFTLLSKWSFTYTNHLVQKVVVESEEMQAFVTSAAGKLKVFTEEAELRDGKGKTGMGDMMGMMGIMTQVKKMSSKADDMFVPWSSLITMLHGYGVQVPSWVLEHVSSAPHQWHLLKMHMFQCRTLLEDFIAREQVRLQKEAADIVVRASTLRASFLKDMPYSMVADMGGGDGDMRQSDGRESDYAYQALDAQRRLKDTPKASRTTSMSPTLAPAAHGGSASIMRIASAPCVRPHGAPAQSAFGMRVSLATLMAELEELNGQEDMFDLPQTVHEGLEACDQDMGHLKAIWDLVSLATFCYQRWQDMPWQGLNLQLLRLEVTELMCTVTSGGGDDAGDRLRLHCKRWPVYVSLKDRVQSTLQAVDLLTLLKSPNVRPRHWKQVARFTGGGMLGENDMRLADLLALNLPAHASSLELLVLGAEKESEIETQLDHIEKEWSRMELEIVADDWGHQLLLPPHAILSLLHQSLVQVQLLNFNTYVMRNSTFSDNVARLQRQLGSSETLLNNWLLAQHKHSTLYALFCTQTARRETPELAAHFDAIDASWNGMMEAAGRAPNVVQTCQSDERQKHIKTLLEKLEESQMLVVTYLNWHRQRVPRLFLLEDQGLLMLLSLEGHASESVPYLRILFPGVDEVGIDFKDNGETQVLSSVRDQCRGRLTLTCPIRCDKGVDEWIESLESALPQSMSAQLVSVIKSMALDKKEATSHSLLQLLLVAIAISNTHSIQQVLDGIGSGSLQELIVKEHASVDCYVELLRVPEAQEEERGKMSALLVDALAWRDVLLILGRHPEFEVSSSSFAWTSQLRYSLNDKKECVVEIGTHQVAYAYAFLGHEQVHIIRTAQLRAMQLALLYHVQMSTGVQIEGGCGSGKSHTLRATAHALGNVCGVCVGTASMTASAALERLVAYSHAGAWLELRNLPHMSMSVLSTVSQAAHAVLQACRVNRGAALARARAGGAGKKDSSEEMEANINGMGVCVGRSFALLTISLPSEAGSGQWQLPASVATLFRPVGIEAVRPEVLIEVWLILEGFKHPAHLAPALSNLIVMCRRSLSPAGHYAWTLQTCKTAIQGARGRIAIDGARGKTAIQGARGKIPIQGVVAIQGAAPSTPNIPVHPPPPKPGVEATSQGGLEPTHLHQHAHQFQDGQQGQGRQGNGHGHVGQDHATTSQTRQGSVVEVASSSSEEATSTCIATPMHVSKLMEMHMLASAVMEQVLPRLLPQDHATFLTLANHFLCVPNNGATSAQGAANLPMPAKWPTPMCETARLLEGDDMRRIALAQDTTVQHTTLHIHAGSPGEAGEAGDGASARPTSGDAASGPSNSGDVACGACAHAAYPASPPSLDAAPSASAQARPGHVSSRHVSSRHVVLSHQPALPFASSSNGLHSFSSLSPWPAQSHESQGKERSEGMMEQAAQQLGLQATKPFVQRCQQFMTLRDHFPSTLFLLGPAGSGKSSLFRVTCSAAAACASGGAGDEGLEDEEGDGSSVDVSGVSAVSDVSRRSGCGGGVASNAGYINGGVASNVRYINPKAMNARDLFGFWDHSQNNKAMDGKGINGSSLNAKSSNAKWMNGVLPGILRDMEARQQESGAEQWVVLDGSVDARWAETFQSFATHHAEVVLGNQECIKRSPRLRLLFESDTLEQASPGMVGAGGILALNPLDVPWYHYHKYHNSLNDSLKPLHLPCILNNPRLFFWFDNLLNVADNLLSVADTLLNVY